MATGFTPATYRRGVPLTRLGRRANPFPIVQLPYHSPRQSLDAGRLPSRDLAQHPERSRPLGRGAAAHPTAPSGSGRPAVCGRHLGPLEQGDLGRPLRSAPGGPGHRRLPHRRRCPHAAADVRVQPGRGPSHAVPARPHQPGVVVPHGLPRRSRCVRLAVATPLSGAVDGVAATGADQLLRLGGDPGGRHHLLSALPAARRQASRP